MELLNLDWAKALGPLPFILAAAVAVLVFALAMYRRRYRSLETAFEPGSVVMRMLWIEGRWSGFSFRYGLQERTQHSPGGARLTALVMAPGKWRAVKVTGGAQLAELAAAGLVRLGVLEDVEVGDPVLDRELRIAGADVQNLAIALKTVSVRESLYDLVAMTNFHSIDVRRDRVAVQFRPRAKGLDDSADVLRDRMTTLARLLSALGYSPTFAAPR